MATCGGRLTSGEGVSSTGVGVGFGFVSSSLRGSFPCESVVVFRGGLGSSSTLGEGDVGKGSVA